MTAGRVNKGFTLIEMMVVIFIIGISITAVSLVVGRGGPEVQLREAAEKFATLGNFASERAILTGQPVGLMLEPPAWRGEEGGNLGGAWQYRWQRMGRGGWEDEPAIDPVALPESTHLDVTIEGQMWEWEEAPEVRLPVAVFYPSGEVTPFVIEFRDERIPDYSQHVEVDVWGNVNWREGPGGTEANSNGF